MCAGFFLGVLLHRFRDGSLGFVEQGYYMHIPQVNIHDAHNKHT